jgi:hypothetical protein
MIIFNNQLWIDRQLEKVIDPKRREFLRQLFSGEDGWQKFLTLMRNRKGAREFITGEWMEKIPTYSKAELHLKKYPCAYGCDFLLPPKFSPWGELCEDIIPICPKCLLNINNKNNQNKNMINQNTTNEVAAPAVVNPSTEPANNVPQVGVTLEELVTQWPNLKDTAKLRLGQRIVLEIRERIKKEVAALEANVKDLKKQIGEMAPDEKVKGKPGRPKKNSGELAAA